MTAGGSRLDVWLPVPQSDAQQRVSAVSIRTDLPYEMQTETDYGNAVLHAWTDRATAATIELIFSCTRLPEHGLPGTTTENVSKEPAPEARDLSPIAWA